MTILDVYELYRQQIRILPQRYRLRLLSLIAADLELDALTLSRDESEPARSLMDYHGVGRASWDGSDAQERVNKLREEWDEREREW